MLKSGFTIKIIRCRNLPARDVSGFSDPYVKLKLGSQQKQKTKVVKHTLSPVYNTEFHYDSWGSREKLTVEVWDWNRMVKNEAIGFVVISRPDDKAVTSKTYDLENKKGQKNLGTIEINIINEKLQFVEADRKALVKLNTTKEDDRPITPRSQVQTIEEKEHTPKGQEVKEEQDPLNISQSGASPESRRFSISHDEKEELLEREREFNDRIGRLEEENRKQAITIATLQTQVSQLQRLVGTEENPAWATLDIELDPTQTVTENKICWQRLLCCFYPLIFITTNKPKKITKSKPTKGEQKKELQVTITKPESEKDEVRTKASGSLSTNTTETTSGATGPFVRLEEETDNPTVESGKDKERGSV